MDVMEFSNSNNGLTHLLCRYSNSSKPTHAPAEEIATSLTALAMTIRDNVVTAQSGLLTSLPFSSHQRASYPLAGFKPANYPLATL
ncbi:MAG: hypothetical protein E7146_05380 [Rikenellaceae bacterium]|nr:hypothetical protein [Rikenellaceae bacterium]